MKKIGVSALVLLLLIVAAGCGQKPQAGPEDNQPSQVSQITDPGIVDTVNGSGSVQGSGDGAGTDQNSQGPEEITQEIKVFLADDEIMDLYPSDRSIRYTEELDKYEEAFKELQKAEPGKISLWEKVILNSVQFTESEVTLDISLPDEARLGSGGEAMAIDALKQTYFQFDEVKELELTVDGEKLESLMGHVELEHPFTK